VVVDGTKKRLAIPEFLIEGSDPGPGEVLVKTRACGICGSDLHALKHADHAADAARRSGSFFHVDPNRDFVPGHEFCAEIVDYGPMTEGRLKPGTLVCSEPVIAGVAGLVPVGFSNDVPGGYAQCMRLMEGLLVEVPSGLAPEHAALTEPIAVGVHAVARARPGDLRMRRHSGHHPAGHGGAEPDAQIVVVGVCMEPDTFEPMFAINKELDVRFTFGHSQEEFGSALRHIAEGTIDADALLTGVTGLAGVANAFDDLAAADTHAKIVIDPWREGGLETR
jgi:threonine dehydrogenase-like Zn-dependent dehydrogenase